MFMSVRYYLKFKRIMHKTVGILTRLWLRLEEMYLSLMHSEPYRHYAMTRLSIERIRHCFPWIRYSVSENGKCGVFYVRTKNRAVRAMINGIEEVAWVSEICQLIGMKPLTDEEFWSKVFEHAEQSYMNPEEL